MLLEFQSHLSNLHQTFQIKANLSNLFEAQHSVHPNKKVFLNQLKLTKILHQVCKDHKQMQCQSFVQIVVSDLKTHLTNSVVIVDTSVR